MKILSIVLEGYKRLLTNDVSYLEYRPLEKMQLILGSNGSGKSSLLKELTPLPAIKNEYLPTGKKIIEIEHNSSYYTLTSDFSTSHPHSFIKDGIEINDGGTFQIQKELVKQYFNITPEIHELLISSENFTQYSLLERRKWFIQLSNTDYTFSIKLYTFLKENHRDILGALKLAKSKLVTLENNILDSKNIDILKTKLSTNEAYIEKLLDMKVKTTFLDSSISEDIIIKIYRSMCKDIKEKNYLLKESDILETIGKLTYSIESLQYENTKLEKLYNENNEVLSIMENSNIAKLEDIEKDTDIVVKEISLLTNSVTFKFNYEDIDLISNSVLSINDLLNWIFDNIPVNNGEYSGKAYSELVGNIDKINLEVKDINLRLKDLDVKITALDHIKTHDKVECPNCEYKWILGYDEDTYKALVLERDKLQTIFLTLNAEYDLLSKSLVSMKEYLDIHRQYVNLRNNNPTISFFFKEIEDNNTIYSNPSKCNILLNTLLVDIETYKRIKYLHTKKLELEKLLEISKTIDLNEKDKILLKNDEIFSNISLNIKTIETNQSSLEYYKKQKDKIARINEKVIQLQDYLKMYDRTYIYQIETLMNNTLNSIIQSIKLDNVEIETELQSSLNVHTAIKDLNYQIQTYEQQVEDYTSLLNILSPTNGLIGKSIVGFINTFIGQMNNIINQIWSYPMNILDCDIEEDELNYRFPVQIKNSDRPIPDIKKVSSGMREIIDLSFKIITMKYLGLEDYPLYLDEFGRTFDNYHRQSAINVINNLLLQSDFSQLFLISHYQDSYGSFTNCDVNVLCKENIVLPKTDFSNRLLTK